MIQKNYIILTLAFVSIFVIAHPTLAQTTPTPTPTDDSASLTDQIVSEAIKCGLVAATAAAEKYVACLTIPTEVCAFTFCWNTGKNCDFIKTFKDNAETPFVRCLARGVFNLAVQQTMETIKGSGRNGGPAFIQNWRNFQTEAQYRGEDIFRTVLNSTNVCPHLRSGIDSAFRTDLVSPTQSFLGTNIRTDALDPFTLRGGCTLPQNFDLDAYLKNPSANGGFEAFVRLLEPQNNFGGLYAMSAEEVARQRNLETASDIYEALAGKGFTGSRDGCQSQPSPSQNEAQLQACIVQCAVTNVGNPAGELACQAACATKYSGNTPAQARCTFLGQVVTPASLLGDSTSSFIDKELDWLTNSTEITDIIINISGLLINRFSNFLTSN